MTIRELADVAGCSYSTLRKSARKLYPEKFRNGKLTVFGEQESVRIMSEVRKRGFVSPMQKAKVPFQNEEVEKLKLILNGAALKELIRIYGEKEAAKRIDHLIGYRKIEFLIDSSVRGSLPVPVGEADAYFSRIRRQFERVEEERKQGELFPRN